MFREKKQVTISSVVQRQIPERRAVTIDMKLSSNFKKYGVRDRRLVVSEKEEGVLALYLPIGPLKTCSVVDPVPRSSN